MTVRSIILGLLLAVALASLGFVNDVWLYFSYIGGDLVPIYAFGLLLIGLLTVNPLLRRLGHWAFSPGEWVTMLAMMFMGSVIAGSGLLWTFPQPIITPIRDQAANPGWQKKDLLQYVPERMMVEQTYQKYARDHGITRQERESWRDAIGRATGDPQLVKRLDDDDARLITGYLTSLSKPGQKAWLVGLADIPWEKWSGTLSFWFAMLSLTFISGLAAVVVVHRQWSHREHLAYPIVTFTNELIDTDQGGAYNPIFRKRLFWGGLGLALAVLMINGYMTWSREPIMVPIQINFNALRELDFIKQLMKVPQAGGILKINLYFAAIGLAYFLTSEASFSLGISGWLFALVMAPLVAYGVDMNNDFLGGGLPAYMYFGAYLGMGIMVLYLGRRFYWAVLKKAFFGDWLGFSRLCSSRKLEPVPTDVLPHETWACRVLLAASAASVALLMSVGLHWLLAVLVVLLTGLLFLMVGRVNTATGLFLVQPTWHAVTVILGLFGVFAIGPNSLIILAMLGAVVTLDPRIAVVPLALNALKLGDLQKVKPGRLAGVMGAAVVISMVVAVVVTIWIIYSVGLNSTSSSGGVGWSLDVAKKPFNILDRNLDNLDATGQLADSLQPVDAGRLLGSLGWSDILRRDKTQKFLAVAGLGMALVLTCSWLRLRFPRWPLHPVMFLVWGTDWMIEYAPSFLVAWLAKSLIMRYGGQKAYFQGRAAAVGLVAGEFTAAIIWAVIGMIYYLHTGRPPSPSVLVRP
jgi:hypothetical protein